MVSITRIQYDELWNWKLLEQLFSEDLEICQDSLESPWLCSNDHRKCSSQISENGSGAVKLLLLWFRTISQAGAITGPMMGQSVASKAATLKLFWSVMTSAHRQITRFPPNPLTRWLSVCECTHVCALPSVQLLIHFWQVSWKHTIWKCTVEKNSTLLTSVCKCAPCPPCSFPSVQLFIYFGRSVENTQYGNARWRKVQMC